MRQVENRKPRRQAQRMKHRRGWPASRIPPLSPSFRTRFHSSRAQHGSQTATRSQSSKSEAPPIGLRPTIPTGSRELTRWPRTIGPCWPLISPQWTPIMGKAPHLKSRPPSSIGATARSHSCCRCHAGAGRTSVSTRPKEEEISAGTILVRAIPCSSDGGGLKSDGQSHCKIAEDQKVISNGPYRYMRHIMYARGLLKSGRHRQECCLQRSCLWT
jgi:hypothetical protein